jgi:Na+/H+ antiporter NhaC
MTTGSWAIVPAQSLYGLIPLILYIVLAMILSKNMILPLIISVFVGFLMSGNGAVVFGSEMAKALGGLMGMIGTLVVMATGLGGVMNQIGVTETLCIWLIRAFHVNSKKRAILTIAAVAFVLAFAVGSGITAAAISIAFMIPVAARFRVRPLTMCVVQLIVGFAGMTLSPFSATNIAAMNITGLPFLEFLGWAAGPYVIVTAATGLFLGFFIDKKYAKVEGGVFYETVEGGENYRTTPDGRRATAAFIVAFVGSIIYMIVTKGGFFFTFFYMVFLTAVIIIFGRANVYESLDTFFKKAGSMLPMFFTLLLLQVMLDTVDAMGGFQALGDVCSKATGSSESQGLFMFVATMFGAFGINGAAASQMMVIDQVFKPMLPAVGITTGMWAMCLLMGSLPSNFLYPGSTQLGMMAVCRCEDFKNVMKACWVTVAVELIVATLYCFITPLIF